MRLKDGFMTILGFQSALACLAGTFFTVVASGGIVWYFIAFYKDVYSVSTQTVGLIWSANTFVYVVSSLLCGRIISRFGKKRMTAVSSILIGLAIFSLIHVPNFYLAIVMGLMMPFFAAIWSASSNALALGQVPEYRGAMMSINSGSMQLGRTVGSFIGGLMLNVGGYSLMGIIFGLSGLLASILVFSSAKEI